MSNPNSVTDLHYILAELYEDPESIRRVAVEADLNMARIALGSSAINNWRAILTEAERTNSIEALVAVARSDHPRNPALRKSAENYRASAEQSQAKTFHEREGKHNKIDIFLSYSHIDTKMMRRLRNDLRSIGLIVWTDEKIEPGTPHWGSSLKMLEGVR